MDMDLLDDNVTGRDKTKNVPIKPTIIKWGKIGSICVLVITILTLVLKYERFTPFDLSFIGFIVSVLGMAVYVVIMTLAVLAYRNENDGFMPFITAFKVSYYTGCIMAIVSLLFSIFGTYFLNLIVDSSSYNGELSNFAIVAVRALFTSIYGFILGAIIAAIISAITKRDRR